MATITQQEAAQFIETLRACAQVIENQNFPFAANDGQRGGNGSTARRMACYIV